MQQIFKYHLFKQINNKMETSGTIHKIYPIVENNGFKSQMFTLHEPHKDNSKYDRYPCFTVKSEKAIEALSNYRKGNKVTIKFDMNSREWNDKVFGENVAWNLQGDASNKTSSQPSAPQVTSDEDDNNLPF